MVFETKKIQLETLGEYLHSVRESLNLSLSEVSARLGTKEAMLVALENEEYSKLPADVYVIGFLKNLASVYSLDAEVLVTQYKKERNVAKGIASQKTKAVIFHRLWRDIAITPKFIAILVGLGFVVLTIVYVVWQVFSINQSPTLEIIEPKDRQIITQSAVKVLGRTNPGMSITINDQSVFVDSEGKFETQLGITPGPRELVFIAKNKFDKTVTKSITVVGEEQPQEQKAGVVLKLEFTAPVTIEYSIDGKSSQKEIFTSGQSTVLYGAEDIVLAVSDAGAVTLTYNEEEIGVLGREGEPLEGIPFSAKSGTMNGGM